MKRWQAAVLAGIMIVVGSTYAAGWYILASQFQAILPSIPQQAAQYGIILDGQFSRVKNFPFLPEVDFSGKIGGPDGILIVPLLETRGLPLLGQTLTMTLSQGARLNSTKEDLDSDLWSVHDLTVAYVVPPEIPSEATAQTLRTWRDAGGKIDIKSFSMHKETLRIDGHGTLTLDDKLQPTGQLDVSIKGYNDFLGYLKHKGLIKKKQVYIIQAILSEFAKQDVSTGENVLNTQLILQNGHLSLGPLEVFTVPEVSWPQPSTPPVSPE